MYVVGFGIHLIKMGFTFSDRNVETPDFSTSFMLPLSMVEMSGVSTFSSEKVNSIFIKWKDMVPLGQRVA